MTSDELARELAGITRSLLTAIADPLGAEPLVARRSALVAEISRREPAAFTADGLAMLAAALTDGDSAQQAFAALQKLTALEWSRLNALRIAGAGETTISVTA
jgi:hypothetical protein